jgi:predicted ABC-type exoprotein transport system permease subunit
LKTTRFYRKFSFFIATTNVKNRRKPRRAIKGILQNRLQIR